MNNNLKKSRKKSEIKDIYFNPKSINSLNSKILKEMSSLKFKVIKKKKTQTPETLTGDFDQVINILSKNVFKSDKVGGGNPEKSSVYMMELEPMSENNQNSENIEETGVSMEELEQMSENNQNLILEKGKLTKAVESIITSKFPFYIRIITVLMKIFICCTFSVLELRQLGSKYFTKFLLGLLIQYPDVCAVLTGNFLTNLGSLGLQLKNFPVIKHIIAFIDTLTMGSLTAANKYLIKIGEFFENNASRTTSFATYFQFMVKILLQSNFDPMNPESWILIVKHPLVGKRMLLGLLGVVSKMLCRVVNISESCQFASVMFRIPGFLKSLEYIKNDFMAISLPFIKHFLKHKRNRDVRGLCQTACFGMFETGDSILGPKNLEETSEEANDRRKLEMRKIYGKTKEDRRLRFEDKDLTSDQEKGQYTEDKFKSGWFGKTKIHSKGETIQDLDDFEDQKYQEYKNSHPNTNLTKDEYIDRNHNALFIDRVVTKDSFDKFLKYVAVPSNSVVSFMVNQKIKNLLFSSPFSLLLPRLLEKGFGFSSWLFEKALDKTGIREMPKRLVENEDGALTEGTDEESSSYKNLKHRLYHNTLGRKGIDLSGQRQKIMDSVENHLETKNIEGLKDMYGSQKELINESLEKGRIEAEDLNAWKQLNRKMSKKEGLMDIPAWYKSRGFLKKFGNLDSDNVSKHMTRKDIMSALSNEEKHHKQIEDFITEYKDEENLDKREIDTRLALEDAQKDVEGDKQNLLTSQAKLTAIDFIKNGKNIMKQDINDDEKKNLLGSLYNKITTDSRIGGLKEELLSQDNSQNNELKIDKIIQDNNTSEIFDNKISLGTNVVSGLSAFGQGLANDSNKEDSEDEILEKEEESIDKELYERQVQKKSEDETILNQYFRGGKKKKISDRGTKKRISKNRKNRVNNLTYKKRRKMTKKKK